MTQDEKWLANWKEVMDFMEANRRRPSKFIPEERGMRNWWKHQLYLTVRLFPERDGNFLPLDTFEAYANGAAKDIAFLQGCNKDEMNYFVSVLGETDFKLWAASRKSKKI